MARVLALVPDLLFGSQVQGLLQAAGHEVRLASSEQAVRDGVSDADVLVVDLTSDTRGADLVESLRADGRLASARTLAFYAHVQADVRARAHAAGFDVVVPRSRMAREGGELVGRLASG